MQGDDLASLLQQATNTHQVGFGDFLAIVFLNIMLVAGIKYLFDGIEYVSHQQKPTHNLKAFVNYSSIIGLVERFLYIIGIWIASPELITIVIAVKTIMRFTSVNAVEKEAAQTSESGDKITAEKYILGTLLNLLLASALVWIFKY